MKQLIEYLNSRVPAPCTVMREVNSAVAEAERSTDKHKKRNAFPEGAFFNQFVLPNVFNFLASSADLL